MSEIKPVGHVYRYGADARGTPWHGIMWYAAGLDLPDKTPIYVADALAAAREEGRQAGLEDAAKVLSNYRVSVGNSNAGELACKWTMQALMECRDDIRALKEKRDA